MSESETTNGGGALQWATTAAAAIMLLPPLPPPLESCSELRSVVPTKMSLARSSSLRLWFNSHLKTGGLTGQQHGPGGAEQLSRNSIGSSNHNKTNSLTGTTNGPKKVTRSVSMSVNKGSMLEQGQQPTPLMNDKARSVLGETPAETGEQNNGGNWFLVNETPDQRKARKQKQRRLQMLKQQWQEQQRLQKLEQQRQEQEEQQKEQQKKEQQHKLGRSQSVKVLMSNNVDAGKQQAQSVDPPPKNKKDGDIIFPDNVVGAKTLQPPEKSLVQDYWHSTRLIAYAINLHSLVGHIMACDLDDAETWTLCQVPLINIGIIVAEAAYIRVCYPTDSLLKLYDAVEQLWLHMLLLAARHKGRCDDGERLRRFLRHRDLVAAKFADRVRKVSIQEGLCLAIEDFLKEVDDTAMHLAAKLFDVDTPPEEKARAENVLHQMSELKEADCRKIQRTLRFWKTKKKDTKNEENKANDDAISSTAKENWVKTISRTMTGKDAQTNSLKRASVDSLKSSSGNRGSWNSGSERVSGDSTTWYLADQVSLTDQVSLAGDLKEGSLKRISVASSNSSSSRDSWKRISGDSANLSLGDRSSLRDSKEFSKGLPVTPENLVQPAVKLEPWKHCPLSEQDIEKMDADRNNESKFGLCSVVDTKKRELEEEINKAIEPLSPPAVFLDGVNKEDMTALATVKKWKGEEVAPFLEQQSEQEPNQQVVSSPSLPSEEVGSPNEQLGWSSQLKAVWPKPPNVSSSDSVSGTETTQPDSAPKAQSTLEKKWTLLTPKVGRRSGR